MARLEWSPSPWIAPRIPAHSGQLRKRQFLRVLKRPRPIHIDGSAGSLGSMALPLGGSASASGRGQWSLASHSQGELRRSRHLPPLPPRPRHGGRGARPRVLATGCTHSHTLPSPDVTAHGPPLVDSKPRLLRPSLRPSTGKVRTSTCPPASPQRARPPYAARSVTALLPPFVQT